MRNAFHSRKISLLYTLRFDVETKNVATLGGKKRAQLRLRFDVETKNVATSRERDSLINSCGLM